jgi:hypothetical protein
LLEAIGRVLEKRGDTEGARQALQQAIDSGSDWADYLIEELHPTPEPTDAELDKLPPQFDPRNIERTGLEVLSSGLPALPEELSYQMAIPVAYWTTQHSAVVLFLKFKPRGRRHDPRVQEAVYNRVGTGWMAANDHMRVMARTSFAHDPIAAPGSQRDLYGSALVPRGISRPCEPAPGRPVIQHGRAAHAVRYLAVIQDGKEDLRPLESHFGAWVVCTDQLSSAEIEARDADGNVLDRTSIEP